MLVNGVTINYRRYTTHLVIWWRLKSVCFLDFLLGVFPDPLLDFDLVNLLIWSNECRKKYRLQSSRDRVFAMFVLSNNSWGDDPLYKPVWTWLPRLWFIAHMWWGSCLFRLVNQTQPSTVRNLSLDENKSQNPFLGPAYGDVMISKNNMGLKQLQVGSG